MHGQTHIKFTATTHWNAVGERNILTQCLYLGLFFLDLPYLEDEGAYIFRNVGNYSHNDTASHLRRLYLQQYIYLLLAL
jgi:hypothetical protein